MDGFKNSTKTQYMKGGDVSCYKKGGSVKGAAKIAKVMGEFKSGKLHSGSKHGPEVKNPKQAMAIAMSEARKAPMKKADGGGVFNERGKRATWAETAAEGRRVEGRKPPVEGISTRPTDDSGRRMTNEELNLTPGGAAKKKAMPKGMGAMSNIDKERAKKKAMPKVMSDLERARAMVTRPLPMKNGGVPAHSDRPMIRRKAGGLSAMPKGKC